MKNIKFYVFFVSEEKPEIFPRCIAKKICDKTLFIIVINLIFMFSL